MRLVKALMLAACLGLPGIPAASAEGPSPRANADLKDCYHSFWVDSEGEVGHLDIASYGTVYDCSTGTWSFTMSTFETWPSFVLARAAIGIDVDGNPATGCGGFDWTLQGPYTGLETAAELVRTPSCDPDHQSRAALTVANRPDGASITLTVSNTLLGSPSALRWFGYLRGFADPTGDYGPDQGHHLEFGFAGPCSPVPVGLDDSSSYLVADEPAVAAGALAAAGLSDVRHRGAGVVSFDGDPSVAARALTDAKVDGPITLERTRGFFDIPNDPGYGSQWALPAVNAPEAWSRTHGSGTVVVASVDSGIDASHPDLVGKLAPGFDAVTGTPLSPGNSDVVGHGTATAGVIAAATGNGTGLASLGWDTVVMPIKVGDSTPTLSAVTAAIRYAADHGARVINISAGGPCRDQNEADAVAYAQSKGVLVVAATGNDFFAGNRINYPAALPGVLAVGASDFDGDVALYSNEGNYVSLVAPGGSGDGNPVHDITLLAPGGGVRTSSGTSYSAPLVSAAAALVLSIQPSLDGDQVAGILTSTAVPLGTAAWSPAYGYGLLDVGAAVAAAAPFQSAGRASGYWMVTEAGEVFSFGNAEHHGSVATTAVDIEPSPTGDGYWILSVRGEIFTRGDAGYQGNAILLPGERAVSLSATPTGQGYWIFTDRGRVIPRGNAPFLGDLARVPLNGPVRGSVATPSGHGYWMVAADGGIFAFGDAKFHGSMGATPLNEPVMSMAASPDGKGYWLVASDGGIFAFGVPFHGSMGAVPLNKPVSGLVPGQGGYLMVAEDGGIFTFGQVAFHGSLGTRPPASRVVAVALSTGG
jgi:hypothetical protein